MLLPEANPASAHFAPRPVACLDRSGLLLILGRTKSISALVFCRPETGAMPILKAVEAAERLLIETERTKAYLGPEGG